VPPQPQSPIADRNQRGFVLVYVSVLGILMALMWVLAWRGTQDAIRVERSFEWREARDTSVIRAGAEAMELMETGLPPTEPTYSCIITIVDEDEIYNCTVLFSSVVYWHTWTVDVWPSTDAELATLPAAPGSF
jgi:hypothetical protein